MNSPIDIKLDKDDEHVLRSLISQTEFWGNTGLRGLQPTVHNHPDYQTKRYLSETALEHILNKYVLLGFVNKNYELYGDGYIPIYSPNPLVKHILS